MPHVCGEGDKEYFSDSDCRTNDRSELVQAKIAVKRTKCAEDSIPALLMDGLLLGGLKKAA